LFVKLETDSILILQVGQYSSDEDLIPVNGIPIINLYLLVRNLNWLTIVICGFDIIESMIDENILALNETQVFYNKFQELILSELNLIL
jgi:hypothetical protein